MPKSTSRYRYARLLVPLVPPPTGCNAAEHRSAAEQVASVITVGRVVSDGIALAPRSVQIIPAAEASQALALVLSEHRRSDDAVYFEDSIRRTFARSGCVISVEFDVAPDLRSILKQFTAQGHPLTWRGAVDIVESSAFSEVGEMLGRALVAACISRPGRFQALEALCLYAGRARALEGSAVALDFSIGTSSAGWPKMTPVDAVVVYEWLKMLPGFRDGVGRGRFGRAVAALSYTSSFKHAGESDILWPLIGLEALYCSGKEGLQAQILRKSEVYLAPRLTHKKALSSVYEVRSKFVHGQIDMPMAYTSYDGSDEYGRMLQEFGDARDLAAKVLVATLQKAASERRLDLEFAYHVQPGEIISAPPASDAVTS